MRSNDCWHSYKFISKLSTRDLSTAIFSIPNLEQTFVTHTNVLHIHRNSKPLINYDLISMSLFTLAWSTNVCQILRDLVMKTLKIFVTFVLRMKLKLHRFSCCDCNRSCIPSVDRQIFGNWLVILLKSGSASRVRLVWWFVRQNGSVHLVYKYIHGTKYYGR